MTEPVQLVADPPCTKCTHPLSMHNKRGVGKGRWCSWVNPNKSTEECLCMQWENNPPPQQQ